MKHTSPFRLIIKSITALVLTSAVIHLTATAIYSISHRDLDTANAFHIVGLDLLIPSLGTGVSAFWLSAVFCIAVAALWYVIFLFRARRRTTQEDDK